MKAIVFACWALMLALVGTQAMAAQPDLEINTPAIANLQSSMQGRHRQLTPYYESGAIGLTRDGNIALRDPGAVPLAQRAQLNALIASENQDRAALYREIARANGHPEWEPNVRSTFASRWIEKARPGWYYQSGSGQWTRK